MQLLGRAAGNEGNSQEEKAKGTFDEISKEPEPGDDLPF